MVNEATKKKRDRSAAYPSINLGDAVDALLSIRKDLGSGPYDRLSAAKALGYSGVSGASASKIAALVHYGLIDRISGGYYETELGKKIVNPFNDDEKNESLLEAFQSPKLFSELLQKYSGDVVPEKLDVLLHRHHKITEAVSGEVANIFRESAEYVGLLRNGYLSESTSATTDIEPRNNSNQDDDNENTNQRKPVRSLDEQVSSSIDLGMGIYVSFPNELMKELAAGKFQDGISSLLNDIDKLDSKDETAERVENGKTETHTGKRQY